MQFDETLNLKGAMLQSFVTMENHLGLLSKLVEVPLGTKKHGDGRAEVSMTERQYVGRTEGGKPRQR